MNGLMKRFIGKDWKYAAPAASLQTEYALNADVLLSFVLSSQTDTVQARKSFGESVFTVYSIGAY